MSEDSNLNESQIEMDEDIQDKVVIFMLDKERFALPMSCVQEIIRPPKTVKVPLSRSILVGLANLRGRVLPIFDTHRMLGLPTAELSESSRALVVSGSNGSSQALLVDRVIAVQDFDENQVDWDVQAIDTDVQSSWLQGLIRQDKDVVMLMDAAYLEQSLVGATSGAVAAAAASSSASAHGQEMDEDLLITDEMQLVTLEINDQVYGLPIDRVREIVHCPERMIEVPGSRSELLGVMTLRERLLPLLSLRSLFGLAQPDLKQSNRVVVVELSDKAQVGLIIDRMREVLTINKADLEDVPGIIAEQVRYLESICRPNQGENVISLLDLGGLFNDMAHKAIEETASLGLEESSETDIEEEIDMEDDDDSQWVIFRLDDEEFGVPITSVKEIVRVPEKLNRIPKAPSSLEGVINLRGKVLPVVCQKRRMGMGSSDRSERQRIMVYQHGETQAGFIVDSVSQVMRIAKDHIEAASHDEEGLIVAVAKLDGTGRMVMLIDPSKLMDQDDLQAVPSMGQSTSAAQAEVAVEQTATQEQFAPAFEQPLNEAVDSQTSEQY